MPSKLGPNLSLDPMTSSKSWLSCASCIQNWPSWLHRQVHPWYRPELALYGWTPLRSYNVPCWHIILECNKRKSFVVVSTTWFCRSDSTWVWLALHDVDLKDQLGGNLNVSYRWDMTLAATLLKVLWSHNQCSVIFDNIIFTLYCDSINEQERQRNAYLHKCISTLL